MTTASHSAQDGLQRAAVERVGRAAAAYLSTDLAGALPLGAVREDELRLAAHRMLAILGDDDDELAALESELAARAARAIHALEAIELHGLAEAERTALAAAVSTLHAELRRREDDDVVRAMLDATPAGPLLAGLVFDTDPSTLGPDAQVSYCQAAQRLESATHARLGAGLVAFAGSNPRQTSYWVEGDEYELTDVRASELASALSWSGSKARGAIESARVMTNELDAASGAAASGALQPAAAQAIADGAHLLTAGIDDAISDARAALRLDTDSTADISDRIWELTTARDELLQQYDASVSTFASTHTVAETRRKVRDTLARLDPEGFEARRAKARVLQSGLEFKALPDAMAMITAVMPSEQATACFSAVDAAARDGHGSDPELPIGVRRTDALFAFCIRSGAAAPAATEAAHADHVDHDGAHGGTGARLGAHVDLVMTLEAFLGLTDTPADCVGAGPVPAAAARQLLAQSQLVSFRRVIVDGASGHVIDAGARRYRLTDSERDFILLRDRVCRHPGCNQPARRCEVDHATPYDDGGVTRTDNLGALCSRHHLEKTHGGWTIEESAADGSCTFVSPLGREYRHDPEPLLPWAWPEPAPPDADPA